MSNLLVVDFDYFFFNPWDAGKGRHPHADLYDWSHGETRMMIEAIWPMRALPFGLNDIPLPMVQLPDGFDTWADWWDQFHIPRESKLYFADSNAYAAGVRPGDGSDAFEHVYLYDAHHDVYKVTDFASYRRTYLSTRYTCEDWMMAHRAGGSRLHWRWPTWMSDERGREMADDVFELVHLDARATSSPPPVEFETVFVCRSGAWVPPWCDREFQTLVQSCPVGESDDVQDFDVLRPQIYDGPAWEAYVADYRRTREGCLSRTTA